MAQFSRALGRWNLFRVLTLTLAVAWLAVLGAFVYAAANVQPEVATIVAAAAVAVIAGASFLYAWREPGA